MPAAGNRPSVIAIDGDAMRGVTVGTATGLYAKELVERANMAERATTKGKSGKAIMSSGRKQRTTRGSTVRVARPCLLGVYEQKRRRN